MQYSEVQIRVATADVDTAAAIANLVVPYGLYIEDYSDIEELAPKIAHVDLIEQELLDRDRDHAIIHLYISPEENPAEAVSFVRERLESERIGFSIERAQGDRLEKLLFSHQSRGASGRMPLVGNLLPC